jgi:formate--tetrahydrofolate ligase
VSQGVPREDGFDITVASEVMAVFCLARDLADLKERLGRIIVGYNPLGKPVLAGEIGVQGAMAALLKNALAPNLVQTVEGVPVFVHGGPFANIAHGCNTLIATRLALKLADFVVTEAGFGADLGAEKFFDIKCRLGGLTPAGAVLVVTHRAFAMHGLSNIKKHVDNLALFGVPVTLCINRFLNDRDEDLRELRDQCAALGVPAVVCDCREGGGEGAVELAAEVVRMAGGPAPFAPLYPLDMSLPEKIECIATRIYGAAKVEFTAQAKRELKRIDGLGFSGLPVCMAKTPASLSDDPKAPGCPAGFTLTVSSARVSAGAGFVVVYTGAIMTMPGLPKDPAARHIDVDAEGHISGLF